ncbi:hypothetical protein OIU85_025138 [Salix viminalis]|uniref:Uncharacterized protein n=1 Tax=Salix viminalis TaxID=40686 RepID=A0A9Q0Z5J7_SALVM|nr:hypothetical protein OIU85_025138 [Salix viminalis]
MPVTELANSSQSQRHRFPSLSITDSISHDPNNLLKRKMHAIRQRSPIYHLINKPIRETRRPRRKPPRSYIPIVPFEIPRSPAATITAPSGIKQTTTITNAEKPILLSETTGIPVSLRSPPGAPPLSEESAVGGNGVMKLKRMRGLRDVLTVVGCWRGGSWINKRNPHRNGLACAVAKLNVLSFMFS